MGGDGADPQGGQSLQMAADEEHPEHCSERGNLSAPEPQDYARAVEICGGMPAAAALTQ